MSSDAAATTPSATGEQQSSKRASENDSTIQDGVDGGPPPAKVAKPSSSSADDEDKKLDVKVALKGEGEGSRSRPTDSERVEEEALRSVGLAVGSRLEVMWVLEDDDKSVEKWWGCSVVGAKTGERGGDEGEALPVFTLHYDAFQTFEEADHDVCFVDKYRLLHLEDGAEMTWKIEGGEVDREAVMASLSGEDVDLQEVIAAQNEEEADEGGESIETQSMNALAQLPHHQQIAMAAGYRRMADVVKEHLRAKMRGGGDAVVSAADVENMFRDVRAGVGGNGAI